MKSLQTDAEIINGPPFGRLKVLSRHHQGPGGATFWLCQCSCGKQITTPLSALRRGRTLSCGCLSAERTRELRKSHGKSKSREYAIWGGMKARCLNPQNNGYPRYGGRGIKVCQAWIDSFEQFLADVGPSPKDGEYYSLDRIDSAGHYEPGNVRWATKDVQANNTKSNVLITAFGRTQTLSQWSQEFGVHRKIIQSRIKLLGWPVERAVSESTRGKPGRGRRKQNTKWHELQYDAHEVYHCKTEL